MTVMKIAVINEGTVANIILADTVPDNGVDITGQRGISVGDLYDGTSFSKPAEAQPEEPGTLTKLAFRKRFTTAEKTAIYNAAKTDVLIQVFLDDVNAAESIDTTDADTVAGIGYLQANGLLTAERASAILGTE